MIYFAYVYDVLLYQIIPLLLELTLHRSCGVGFQYSL